MTTRPADRWWGAALLVLALLLVVGTAGWGRLYNETDGQYGGAARVMAAGGSWLIPDNDGIPRLVKPPLLYWGMAASMKIFGVNEFAARLPNALALWAWVAVTFLIGARLGGPWRGFVAGGILLTMLGSFTLGRIIMPEPAFCALIAGALYCALRGFEAEDGGRRGWYLGFWLCASVASFTKGWHGLLYPLVIVGLVALGRREFRPRLRGLLSWTGVLIFLLVNAPWYFYLEAKFPGYFHNLFMTELLGHIVGNKAPATEYTNVPRVQFLLLHLAWFFPWSLVAGCALFSRKARFSAASFGTFMVWSWFLVVLASVLLAGQRQDYYAMALWPAFALLAAQALEGRSLRPGAIVLSVLLGLGLVAAFLLPHLLPDGTAGTVADRSTAWTTLTNFDRSVWANLRLTATFALGGALLFSLLAIWGRGRTAFVALLLAAAALDLGATSGTALVAPFFSLAEVIPAIPANSTLVYDGDIDTGSSLLFYTSQPVVLLDQNPDRDFIVRRFHIGLDRYTTTAELKRWWSSPRPVTLVTESRRLGEWQAAFEVPPLEPSARTGTQIVLRNHP